MTVVNQVNPNIFGLFNIIFHDIKLISDIMMNNALGTIIKARNDLEISCVSLRELRRTYCNIKMPDISHHIVNKQ